MLKPTEFSGREIEDPNNWLERFNRIANANKWNYTRRFQIIGGYLTEVAAKWYDEIKPIVMAWKGSFGFKAMFLEKFVSAT